MRLAQLEPTQTIVKLCQWHDLEAEADEMWSYVGSKKQQRWWEHVTFVVSRSCSRPVEAL